MNPIIQKTITTTKESFYNKHITIVNILLDLKATSKEIEVLSTFLSLDKKIIEDDIFNSLSRKKVRKLLNLSHAGLSNYLRTLLEKGLIFEDKEQKILLVKDYLLPTVPYQGYKIKLIIN